MPNIHIPKAWNSISGKAVEEKIYYNRREIIKQLGLLGGGLLSASVFSSCQPDPVSPGPGSAIESNTFTFEGMDDLYPASPNAAYPLDRSLTEEFAATHYNNFYEFIHPEDPNIYNSYKYVHSFDTSDWEIEVRGQASNKGKFFLGDLIQEIGLEERTYRHRCVEAWSMAVPWTGFPLSSLINFFEPKSSATHIRMTSYGEASQMVGIRTQSHYPWPYFEGLRMDEAMNELTFIATGIFGKPLPKQSGAPIRLVVPWKYGFKSIKSIVKIEFIDKQPDTFWPVAVPSQYEFFSNVDPDIPHPRWSQATERLIPGNDRVPTLKYNGYGEFVASLY
ncbi:MAG: protein-methionine-sulfoxide reductase catalytic subunit MsrP [Bacteroidota bacterium]